MFIRKIPHFTDDYEMVSGKMIYITKKRKKTTEKYKVRKYERNRSNL